MLKKTMRNVMQRRLILSKKSVILVSLKDFRLKIIFDREIAQALAVLQVAVIGVLALGHLL